MSSWGSYNQVYNLGHRAVQDLLKGEVLCEEKIDGSQFSFGIFPEPITPPAEQPQHWENREWRLRIRSKGAEMLPDAPEKMFTKGVEYIKSIQQLLTPGWTYRGEYLAKPKHNALAYDRVPNGYVILFDVNTEEQTYLDPESKAREATRIGLECVPVLFRGTIPDIGAFRALLETTSVLGGQKVEGVVVKPANYDLFGRDHKCLMGKFVSEAFKEIHSHAWGPGGEHHNNGPRDILAIITARLGTQARWAKSVQHLREAGTLEDSPSDIGLLIKEIPHDIKVECEELIKEWLFEWAWKGLSRSVTSGMPLWYKERLLTKAFEDPELEERLARVDAMPTIPITLSSEEFYAAQGYEAIAEKEVSPKDDA